MIKTRKEIIWLLMVFLSFSLACSGNNGGDQDGETDGGDDTVIPPDGTDPVTDDGVLPDGTDPLPDGTDTPADTVIDAPTDTPGDCTPDGEACTVDSECCSEYCHPGGMCGAGCPGPLLLSPPAQTEPILVTDISIDDASDGSPLPTIELPRPSKDPYVEVDRGYNEQYFPYDRDVIIVLPPTPLRARLYVRGGRNVRLIGGHLYTDPGGPLDSTTVMVSLEDIGTSIFVEGLYIDVADNFYDGIVVRTYVQDNPWDVYLQNVYVDNIAGEYQYNHGDVFQNQGARLGSLYVERFVGVSEYQGFFIPNGNGGDPDFFIDSATFRQVYMKNNNCMPADTGDCPTNTIHFFLREATSTGPQPYSPPIMADFDETYVEDSPQWPGAWAGVYPNFDWARTVSDDGSSITFTPEMEATGMVRLGPPPCDFVRPEDIGVHYVSPHP